MKIYDARDDGGFFILPAPPPCAASDECHGPGTPVAPPPQIGSYVGAGGNAQEVEGEALQEGQGQEARQVRQEEAKRSKTKRDGAAR